MLWFFWIWLNPTRASRIWSDLAWFVLYLQDLARFFCSSDWVLIARVLEMQTRHSTCQCRFKERTPPTDWTFSSSRNRVGVRWFGQVVRLWSGLDSPSACILQSGLPNSRFFCNMNVTLNRWVNKLSVINNKLYTKYIQYRKLTIAPRLTSILNSNLQQTSLPVIFHNKSFKLFKPHHCYTMKNCPLTSRCQCPHLPPLQQQCIYRH